MDLKTFQGLPTEQIAQLVRTKGPPVCVFPINGTRRWFILEHPEHGTAGSVEDYLRIGGRRHLELYRMFFDHGVDTLLTPVFGPDLLDRGEDYVAMAAQGLLWFAQAPEFLEFYDAFDVRVRVYGDARRYLRHTACQQALDAFDDLARRTVSHRRHRLFFGVCAHDPAETVAAIGVRFYQEHGRPPNRREIVTAYYGEYVEPVGIFIGFDRLAAFDMPLIATGNEDLYFTVSPSPYLGAHTLRAILYDHLYARRVNEADYTDLRPEDWGVLAAFYSSNRDAVLGLGRRHASGNFWYPLPQVQLPSPLVNDEGQT